MVIQGHGSFKVTALFSPKSLTCMVETWSPADSGFSQLGEGREVEEAGLMFPIWKCQVLCQELGHVTSPKPKWGWGSMVQLGSHME